ncbi:MAG: ABC transporter permease subunit [Desulfurococcales archaeon]|nr:ABC transporter permease subunit [Desulfurococcales archaeon]
MMTRGFTLHMLVLASLAPALLVSTAPIAYAGLGGLVEVLGEERFHRALYLSIVTSTFSASIATALALPPAYLAARRGGFTARTLASLHLLVLGLPPVGVGISLLIALTKAPIASDLARVAGLVYSERSIVAAQTVIALPLAVSVMTATFTYIPRQLEEVALVYGASSIDLARRIILPLAAPGIAAAWLLSFFRSMGEFGATLVLAGVTPGRTETLPIAMYNMLAIADLKAAAALMTLAVLTGLAIVSIVSILMARMERVVEGIGE